MKYLHSLLFFFCLFSCSVVFPQSRFTTECLGFYPDVADTAASDGGRLLLRVENQNFFKNNEYFGDFAEGYTLPGYSLQPTLVYVPQRNLSLEAGAYLLQYGGEGRYAEVAPYLSVVWQATPHFWLRMGNLDGGMRHGLHDAVLADERQLTHLPEQGVQIRTEARHLSTDVWVDWQQFIRRGDTIPEKLTGGAVVRYRFRPDAAWQPTAEAGMLFSHVGGQISDYPERMTTYGNGHLRLGVFRCLAAGQIEEWGVAATGFFFRAMAGRDVLPFEGGRAVDLSAWVRTRYFDFQCSYFASHNYYAPYGNPLYSVLADREPYCYKPNRRLITAEANLCYPIAPFARFALGAKLYYDTPAQHLDYLYAFYLTLNPKIRIR